jgi:hypothetical protein
MIDLVFDDALYWLFMNKTFVQTSMAFLTFLAIIISLLIIIKKWGGSY